MEGTIKTAAFSIRKELSDGNHEGAIGLQVELKGAFVAEMSTQAGSYSQGAIQSMAKSIMDLDNEIFKGEAVEEATA